MRQRGDGGAHLVDAREIEIGRDDAHALAAIGQHLAPGVDDERVAEGPDFDGWDGFWLISGPEICAKTMT